MIVIDDQDGIDGAMNQLADRLEAEGEYIGFWKIPTKRGVVDAPTYWFGQHRLWWGYEEGHSHWNAFGVSDRRPEFELDAPIVEINFPIENPYYDNAGAFVMDRQPDRLYVAHSGRVGGGRPGIGRTAFMEYAIDKLDWWPCGWMDRVEKVALISLLDSEQLVKNIAAFVDVVKAFKASV